MNQRDTKEEGKFKTFENSRITKTSKSQNDGNIRTEIVQKGNISSFCKRVKHHDKILALAGRGKSN